MIALQVAEAKLNNNREAVEKYFPNYFGHIVVTRRLISVSRSDTSGLALVLGSTA